MLWSGENTLEETLLEPKETARATLERVRTKHIHYVRLAQSKLRPPDSIKNLWQDLTGAVD